jgi:hypothetical protein
MTTPDLTERAKALLAAIDMTGCSSEEHRRLIDERNIAAVLTFAAEVRRDALLEGAAAIERNAQKYYDHARGPFLESRDILLLRAGERYDVGPGFVMARACPSCLHTKCDPRCACEVCR